MPAKKTKSLSPKKPAASKKPAATVEDLVTDFGKINFNKLQPDFSYRMPVIAPTTARLKGST